SSDLMGANKACEAAGNIPGGLSVYLGLGGLFLDLDDRGFGLDTGLQLQAQLIELLRLDRGGCLEHDVDAALVLRESDDVADALLAGEDHDRAVDAEGDTAVRRRAVLARGENRAEAPLTGVAGLSPDPEDLL